MKTNDQLRVKTKGTAAVVRHLLVQATYAVEITLLRRKLLRVVAVLELMFTDWDELVLRQKPREQKPAFCVEDILVNIRHRDDRLPIALRTLATHSGSAGVRNN